MRKEILFFAVFVLSLLLSCNSPEAPKVKNAMTEKEFAKVYLDSLSKAYPDVKFEISPDLIISSKKGTREYRHYIDNAYIDYKADPDSLNNVIGKYVASTRDLYREKEKINISNIVPVIKPIEYLEEINSLNKDGQKFPMITEKYNDQLIIAYAEDKEKSLAYLTEDDLIALTIPRDSLKAIALKNLDALVPEIRRQGENGLFMITAGGVYEASLILLNSIWTKHNFPVDGDFIIAIPNRDMLMITGSKNKNGIDKMKGLADSLYKSGNYQVSEHLYKWTGKKFEKFD